MKALSKQRFEAIAGYCRQPTTIPVHECEWYEVQDERLIGFILFEGIDEEYGGIILGRDKNGRYRWVDGTGFSESINTAREQLRSALDKQARESDESFEQGDEPKLSTELLRPIVGEERMGTLFRTLVQDEQFSPARDLIRALSPYFRDLDGNFIEQFQTTAFDARLTELYYFATLHEMGYGFDQTESAPDFHCVDPWADFFVEAVTAQPTKGVQGPQTPTTPEEAVAYILGYAAIKFGGALYSKLGKQYWEKPHVTGKPLVIAVQNFSNPMPMIKAATGLSTYLYGWFHDSSRDAHGNLVITPRRIAEHRYGEKVIPSNFFAQPGAEHISAVLHNPDATISKFNRMGVLAGFGSERIEYHRVGFLKDHDPNASVGKTYSVNVRDANYRETWSEGLSVYHNPRAVLSLQRNVFPGAAHHYLREDGFMESFVPEHFPLGSVTYSYRSVSKT